MGDWEMGSGLILFPAIPRSDLLRAVICRDSDDTASPLGNGADGVCDRVEYGYNRQRQRTQLKDQNETIHAFEYDKLGRLLHDRVTTLGTDIDGGENETKTKRDRSEWHVNFPNCFAVSAFCRCADVVAGDGSVSGGV